MTDIVCVASLAVLFVLSVLYVYGCDGLKGKSR